MEGGEGGIRTLGTREGTAVFETVAFDHSATSPFVLTLAQLWGVGRMRGAKVEFHSILQGKDPINFIYFCS